MAGHVSTRSAELALMALGAALARNRHNGAPVPADVTEAINELHAAVVAGSGQKGDAQPPPPAVLVSPQLAAQRLGVSVRTIARWAADGKIPATKVGRRGWVIHWTGELEWEHRKRQQLNRQPRRRATA